MNNKEVLSLFFQSALNTPYIWAGDSMTKGVDCSGFVQLALYAIGADPKGDQTADALYRHFKSPTNGRGNVLQFGTLLFFGREEKITHIAIALNQTSMIEAAGGGSKTKTVEDAIQQKAYVKITPIRRRSDLVAKILPMDLS